MGGIKILLLYIIGVLSVGFGVAVLFHQRKSLATWSFFFVTLCIALWSVGIAIFLSTDQSAIASFAVRLYYIAAAGIAVSIFINAVSMSSRKRTNVRNALLLSSPFAVLAGLIWFLPSFLLESITLNSTTANTVSLNMTGYMLYGFFFLAYFCAAIAYMALRVRREEFPRRRLQLQYVVVAYLLSGAIGVIFNLILPAIGNYDLIWIGPLGVFVLIPFVYATIAIHGLYDMREAAVRSIAYIMTLLTLSFVYYGLAVAISQVIFIVSQGQESAAINPLSIVLALVLAYVFQPIKNVFDKITNRIFFRASYKPEEFTSRLGKIFTSTVKLDELLERSAEEIATTLKASHATFVVYDEQRNSTVVSHGVSRSLKEDVYEQISTHLQKANEEIVLVDEIIRETYEHTEIGKLYRTLRRKNIVLILPLHGEFGFLLLGEQKAGGYSQRDYRVLNSLISELSIAIQNALSIQELQELNTTLQQRIDDATSELRKTNQKLRQIDATKDEFISMASHQLRTPLTSIKGYLSMVLEGDVGEVSDAQRAMLAEAFTSSERMVHLIGDFLNVSRLQTGKFMLDTKPSDVAQMVADEVESIQRLAKSHGVELEFRKPRVAPILHVDEDKLRQVTMNFIDNAIYYSPEHSTVKVKLEKRDGNLCLEVHDEGMGVPEDVQHRLFTKFFRADNARKQRPDGTGIGLYLAKKVITAHGGDIIFRSKKGKGSVFGFCLPIAKLRDKPETKE